MSKSIFLTNEKVLEQITPHRLTFIGLYVVSFYLVALGFIFWLFEPQLRGIVAGLSPASWRQDLIFSTMWWFSLMIPALTAAITTPSWKLYITLLGAGSFCIFLPHLYGLPPEGMQIAPILCGAVGFLLTEVYRQAHTFYITDRRIITRIGFVSYRIRDIDYDKITNLILDKGVLGRMFNFATIVPVVSSGLGLRPYTVETAARAKKKVSRRRSLGVRADRSEKGERVIEIPMGRTTQALFGVPKPEEVHRLISDLRHKQGMRPYSQEIPTGTVAVPEFDQPQYAEVERPYHGKMISEDDLLDYVDRGYEIVKQLEDGRIVVRKPVRKRR